MPIHVEDTTFSPEPAWLASALDRAVVQLVGDHSAEIPTGRGILRTTLQIRQSNHGTLTWLFGAPLHNMQSGDTVIQEKDGKTFKSAVREALWYALMCLAGDGG